MMASCSAPPSPLVRQVALILVACAVQTYDANGVTPYTVILSLILFAGTVAVPLTVFSFRHAYRPLLTAYRHGHGLPSGIGSEDHHWSEMARSYTKNRI